MLHSTIERRNRNRVSTRALVLAAAERLFAARGYESATIDDIAREAGVSRGTPSYFFGSKRGLYEAVLADALDRARRAVEPAIEAARAHGGDAHEALAGVVDGIVDFVIEDPHFARLVQWEALAGHRPRAAEGLREGARGTYEIGSLDFLMGLVTLCALPLDQGDSVRQGLGLDWRDPEFLALRKRHVLEVLTGRP